jgi:hypothetical protein
MGARKFGLEPPGEDYRQIGWHCVYQEQQGRRGRRTRVLLL